MAVAEARSTTEEERGAGGRNAAAPPVPPPPAPRFYTERECARLQGFPDSYRLEGAKQYHQLGNAVNPLLVKAVGESILRALDGDAGVAGGDSASAGETGGGAGKRQRLLRVEEESSQRCEDFLCASAINLLRGVTPPAGEKPPPPPPDAAVGGTAETVTGTEGGYGRYGEEDMAERRRRVECRPANRLFCMRCVQVYSLEGKAQTDVASCASR